VKIFRTMAVVFTVLAAASGLYAHETADMKDMDMKGMKMGACRMMDEAACPFCVRGAAVKVVNTKDGIQVLVTASGRDTIKEIQEKGAKFAASCGSNKSAEKKGAASATVKETTLDGDPEEIVQCPVMGTKIKKKDAVAVLEYNGKKYYICCKMCIAQFKSNPEKYIK
jgi:YHS domain-containing protein